MSESKSSADQWLNAQRRMEVMLQMFQKLLTPEQKELADLVEKRGGNAILDDEHAMRELSAAEASLAPASGRHENDRFDLAEIQHEIRDDPTDAIQKNAEFFNRKFDMQRRQIEEDVARAVRREGDRIITAVTAGPHDRIVDPVGLTFTLPITSKSTSHVCLRIYTKSGETWWVQMFPIVSSGRPRT